MPISDKKIKERAMPYMGAQLFDDIDRIGRAEAVKKVVDKLRKEGLKEKKGRMFKIIYWMTHHMKNSLTTLPEKKRSGGGHFTNTTIQDFYAIVDVKTKFSEDWIWGIVKAHNAHFRTGKRQITTDDNSNFLSEQFIYGGNQVKHVFNALFGRNKNDFTPVEEAFAEAKKEASVAFDAVPGEIQEAFFSIYEKPEQTSSFHRDITAKGPSVIIPLMAPHASKLILSRLPQKHFESGSAVAVARKVVEEDENMSEEVTVKVGQMLIMRQNLTHAYLGMEDLSETTPRVIFGLFF